MRELEAKKKRVISPKDKRQVSKNLDFEDLMSMMKACIEEANADLWQKVDNKISSYEAKIDKLEGAIFERDLKIDQLETDLIKCQETIQKCDEQLEEMERHSRATNLVLTSQSFGRRREGENITELTINVINESYPDIRVTKEDFSAIHRLAKDNTVICAFRDKDLRNKIYERRIHMRTQTDFSKRLFVNENLTKAKSMIFAALLQLKKKGKVWTVFSKAGIPCYKVTKTASPIRVHSAEQLAAVERDLIQPGAAPAPVPAPAPGGRARAGPPPARLVPLARPGPPLGVAAERRGAASPLPRRADEERGGGRPVEGRPESAGGAPTDAARSQKTTDEEDVSERRVPLLGGPPSTGSVAMDAPPTAATGTSSSAGHVDAYGSEETGPPGAAIGGGRAAPSPEDRAGIGSAPVGGPVPDEK